MKIKILIITITFLLMSIMSKGQDKNAEFVYNWFDHSIGSENLAINNGTIHKNSDRTLNNENRYYINEFSKGNLNYENQDYFNINLKYDIFNDVLILNPSSETNYINVDLIKENVLYFSINNKKFANLTISDKFKNGYYEENFIGKYFVFYIKHYKERKEILKENGKFLQYFYKNEFLINRNSIYSKINSKSEIIKLFPELKTQISDFYFMNKNTKKENEIKFMENLIKYINNLSQINTKK